MAKDFSCIQNNSRFSDAEKKHGEELYQQYMLRFGGASDEAIEATEKALTVQQKMRKLDNLRAAKVFAERLLDMEEFVRGNNRYEAAVLSFIAPDYQGHRRFLNLENEQDAIKGMLLANMSEFVMQYRKRGVTGKTGSGFQGFGKNKVPIEDVIRESAGIDTGNPQAKMLGKMWNETAEMARLLKNKYGAHIPKNESWFFPQSHSQGRIRALPGSFDEKFRTWRDFILPKLDTERITSYKTGQPITDLELEVLLKDIFENIVNGSQTQSKGWLKTMSNHRVLQFRTAEDLLAYHKRFGEGDIAINMFNYLDQMSHDIAELKVLGPKPEQTLRLLQEKAIKGMRSHGGYKESKVTSMAENIRNHYDVFKRRQLIPQYEWLAEGGSTVRNYATAAYLGSAVLSAMGDFGTQMKVAMQLGESKWSPLKKHLAFTLDILAPMKRAERQQWLVDNGIVIDSFINFSQKKAKFTDDLGGSPLSQTVSDVVLRSSGLTGFTDGGRAANATLVMQTFARSNGQKLAQLDPEFVKILKTYGLDKHWDDVLSKVTPETFQGSKYITYKSIQNHPGNADEMFELATSYLAMIKNLQNDAVITNSIKTMAKMYGSTKRGSLIGELGKSAFMFKSFSVGIVIQHLMRMLFESPDIMRTKHFGINWNSKIARTLNVGKFVVTMTILGGIAEQIHQLKSGRDPKDMKTGDFAISALTRGGGLGFIGDIITNNAMGYSLQLLGPLGNFASDAFNMGVVNPYKSAFGDEDVPYTYDAYKMLKKYMPGQSLWWGQLAFNRLVLENIATAIDPQISRKIRSTARRQESKNKQKYWWKPGDLAPKRAPDMTKANLGELLTIDGD